MLRHVLVLAVGAGLLVTACGGASGEEPPSPTPTTAPATTSSATPTPVTEFDRWAAGYRPYATSATDISQSVFEFQKSLCTTLRRGGEPATELWPAKSSAEVLREGWGVGEPGVVDRSSKEKAEVAEKVIIPILCPDQTHVIDDAKAGNYTKAVRTAFANGSYIVGEDIAPGTYRINTRVSDCYWERSDSQGNIIDNNMVSIAPSITVTIAPTDGGFTSKRCGTWKLVE